MNEDDHNPAAAEPDEAWPVAKERVAELSRRIAEKSVELNRRLARGSGD